MEVNSLFLIIKAKLPARTLHHQEKKNGIYFCYASGQNLPWFKLTFLLPGNDKDYENEFLQKKIYGDQGHFAYSTESFRFYTEKYVIGLLTQTSI